MSAVARILEIPKPQDFDGVRSVHYEKNSKPHYASCFFAESLLGSHGQRDSIRYDV